MELNTYSIEFLKSGLSVNTHVGCGLGCKYCVLSTGISGFPDKPVYINAPVDILRQITGPQAFFINGLTPIYINNRTDPFLPEVIESTYELLDLFRLNNITSPIIIISKLAPDERFRVFTSDLNILYFYTFSGLVGLDYNSKASVNGRFIELIEKNVPLANRFHYYRPIITGHNDSEEQIRRSILLVKSAFRLTVAGGLRLNANNAQSFSVFEYDKNHKYLSRYTWEMIGRLSRSVGHPIVRHTSCAVSVYMEKPNNFDYFNRSEHCLGQSCPCFSTCSQKTAVDTRQITSFLDGFSDISYEWDDHDVLIFRGPVRQELLAFLRSTFGVGCFAKNIILSPSEQEITQ